jgi:hypothetical protein
MIWNIENWYSEARLQATAERIYYHNIAELRLAHLEEVLPDVSVAERGRRLVEFHRQRLEAVPSLIKYPELRGMRELVSSEQRGIQDGADFDETQLAAYCSGLIYAHRLLHVLHVNPSLHSTGAAHCSYIFFPTSDHGPLLANNLDSRPTELFGPPCWPAISEHLIFGDVSSGIFLDELSPEIFPAPVTKLVARYCRTTREAVEMLSRYGHFWGPWNRIVIDQDHMVAMIEKSACRMGVRYSTDGFGYITAMSALEPSMQAYLSDRRTASLVSRGLPTHCADTRYWNECDRRNRLLSQLLDKARKTPTLEMIRRIIQFRDPQQGHVCYNGEVFHLGDPPAEHTLRTIIWQLREHKAMWWAWKDGTPSFLNPQPPVEFPDVLWGDHATLSQIVSSQACNS